VVGLDPDFEALGKHPTINARVRGDVSRLPFYSGTFELVSANMVFEHLQEPASQMAEIARVLRPGGVLIFHTPNKYGYGVLVARVLPDWVKARLAQFLQGREEEDVYPTFYRANSTHTIRAMAEQCGLQVREIALIVSTPTLIMIPPLVLFELVLLRALETRWLRPFRTNIIAVLEKPAHTTAGSHLANQGHTTDGGRGSNGAARHPGTSPVLG
jgi:SAM-dependent methyltransferase